MASTRQTMCEGRQFDALGIDRDDYRRDRRQTGPDTFPDLKAKGQLCVVNELTGGATPQDTASIPFKRIQRAHCSRYDEYLQRTASMKILIGFFTTESNANIRQKSGDAGGL